MPLGAVYHAPCSDKCGEILALHEQDKLIRAQGREKQIEYFKMAALELSESERQVFIIWTINISFSEKYFLFFFF